MAKIIVKLFIITIASLAFIYIGYFFISSPKVISLIPADNSENIDLKSSLIIKFDKPLKRKELQPSILPEAYGEWKFEDPLIKNHLFKTIVFEPAIDFEPDTQYEVKLENIKGFGLNKKHSFYFTFKTKSLPSLPPIETDGKGVEIPPPSEIIELKPEKLKPTEPKPEITLLEIPLDWQDHPLSCEAASLKMALRYKGVNLSEEEIMEKIGYDLTPHQGNIWGDPYKVYVGNIEGKICTTGYGVYWEPLAKAAKNWREAQSFSNGKLADLIKEIQLGNPVIVWGALPVSTLTDCSWYTPEGKYIKAYKETHVRLAIGFIGPPENPLKIILNDSLAGQIYWSTSYFLTNWRTFEYSGVIIR